LIDGITRQAVKSAAEAFWNVQVTDLEFKKMATGKEIGHRIADYVDERTTAMLDGKFDTRHEVDRRGVRRPRSMGDVWLKANGIYNPINVKAGEVGKNGQPNMVSLTKLLDALLNQQIDSYDLLIVKMRIGGLPASADIEATSIDPDAIVPNVYFVDMLDYLSFVTFDSGPGQAMLREKQFYDAADAGYQPPALSVAEKIERCMDLMEDGDRRLIENRKRKMERLRVSVDDYQQVGGHLVAQGGLDLG